MLEDVVLKLTERTHQAAGQPPRQTRSDRCILGMLGPLLPGEPIRTRAVGINPRQGKGAGAVMRAGSADSGFGDRAHDLAKLEGLDRDGAVAIGPRANRHRELDQWSGPARAGQDQGAKIRQSSDRRLPEHVVHSLESRLQLLGRVSIHTLPWSVERRSSFARGPHNMDRQTILMSFMTAFASESNLVEPLSRVLRWLA